MGTLWLCQYIAIEHGPVEIVDFPSSKMVDLSSSLRKRLPGGKPPFSIIFPWFSYGFPIKTSIFLWFSITLAYQAGYPMGIPLVTCIAQEDSLTLQDLLDWSRRRMGRSAMSDDGMSPVGFLALPEVG